jgi:hypothetical protein
LVRASFFKDLFFRICIIFSKGFQFGNVLTLLQLLDEKNFFRDMRFCWINKEENLILSEQTSLFRINCVDCLDRTNVVQAAIAKTILEIMVCVELEFNLL